MNIKFSEIELPPNKNFGVFFTFVFAVASVYFYNEKTATFAYIFGIASLLLLIITSVKADLLLPLNKLWMRFGLLLGMIISPIVLGFIFFVLFTPIAFFMRLKGRDELRIKLSKKPSHWILRIEPIKSESFKNQF